MAKRGNGEGSIYWVEQRQRYAAAVTKDDGKRKVLYGTTRQEVAKKLTKALEAKEQGMPLVDGRLTLEKYLAEWLANTVKPARSKRTYLRYETAVRLHINPCIGRIALAKLQPDHVQKLQAQLVAKGLSRNTIDLVRATLSGALQQATRWGKIVRNPVTLVEPPRVIGKDGKPTDADEDPAVLTPVQARAFLSAVSGHEFEHLYTVMLATGLRISEAFGLQWQNVDLDAKRLHVRLQLVVIPGEPWSLEAPKSRSGKRTVPLIPAAVAALKAQRARIAEQRLALGPTWNDHDLVFPGAIGNPLVGRTVARAFDGSVKRADLPHTFTPHSLRHSAGTYLTASGVPDVVVMKILGHSDAEMTRHYQHVMGSMLEDAATQLARIFPATGTEG